MHGPRNPQTWLVLLTVWASFLLYGAIAAPVPGVNEPHYFCKAKHFWQPDWCSKDFFLASPNAHTVFYATIGSLTNILSFPQSAWVGRILAMLVLAWGWTRCLSRLLFTQWAVLWCAWVFLVFAAFGNFSGEWLVGGVEGKVICYGLLMAAFGDVLRHDYCLAATWAGLAISLHPVVGIWGVLAFAMSHLVGQLRQVQRMRRAALVSGSDVEEVRGLTHALPQKGVRPLATEDNSDTKHHWEGVRPRFEAKPLTPPGSPGIAVVGLRQCRPRSFLPFVILFVLALPGLVPVVGLLMEPVSDETRYEGTYLQVYVRLGHHLDPMLFPVRAYLGYAGLLAFWLCSLRWGGRSQSKKAFDQIVAFSILFAIVGVLIGLGPRPPSLMPYFAERMNLLKFYPFRLADVLVPIAVAVSLVSVLERTALFVQGGGIRDLRISYSHLILLTVFFVGLWHASATAETNRYSNEDRADWLDVCRWIDTNLPRDALVQSPANGWAFKWFAQRAEYVAHKDCPQDVAGIVEWNRRLNFLQHWYEQKYSDALYSASELRELRRETGITHLLTDRLGPLELEPIYRNGTFQVYDLSSLDTERENSTR